MLHSIQLKWMFKTVSEHAFNLCAFFLERSFAKFLLNSFKILPTLNSLLCRSLLFQICQIKNIWCLRVSITEKSVAITNVDIFKG